MSGSVKFGKEQLMQLQAFVSLCRSNPSVLHMSELAFFKSYLQSLGANIPEPPKEEPKAQDEPQEKQEKEEQQQQKEEQVESEPEEEIVESEVEIDDPDVVEPDSGEPLPFGDDQIEVTDEMQEQSSAKRAEAQEALAEGKLEEAVNLFTEAIKLNPQVASLYARRAAALLKMNKPNAVMRDCDKALSMNPDLALAYKCRGRAHRLLGRYEDAVKDLATACRIDYTDEANNWLKEATPMATKLADHRRKYERLRLEKQRRELERRRRKLLEEQERAARDSSGDTDFAGAFPGGMPGGLGGLQELLQDPEILEAFQDPEVAEAFQDISENPANMVKYQNNPKIRNLVNKMTLKMGGKMPGAGI